MQAIKKVIVGIGVFFSFIFPYKLSAAIKGIKKFIYNGYIKGQFKSVGKNFTVQVPLSIVGGNYIKVGDNFEAGPRLRIEAHGSYLNNNFEPEILIGNDVQFNFDCHIGCINRVKIGDGVLIGSKVLIIDHYHGDITLETVKNAPLARPLVSKGEITIGNNVWIGEGVAILPGVNIGENSIIGANSVVTKTFERNSVIGGNPAKLIRYLE